VAAKEITREELKAKLDGGEGIVVVETLGPRYYEDAHLPGAINIPHTEVDELAPRLLPDKSGRWSCTARTGRARIRRRRPGGSRL
jgi:rhodanese-related sulfurtransferase